MIRRLVEWCVPRRALYWDAELVWVCWGSGWRRSAGLTCELPYDG